MATKNERPIIHPSPELQAASDRLARVMDKITRRQERRAARLAKQSREAAGR